MWDVTRVAPGMESRSFRFWTGRVSAPPRWSASTLRGCKLRGRMTPHQPILVPPGTLFGTGVEENMGGPLSKMRASGQKLREQGRIGLNAIR